MDNTDLIEIFAHNINLLKKGSLSKEDLINDPLVIKALEFAEIATHGNELKQHSDSVRIKNKQEENIQLGKKKNMGLPWTLEFRYKLITQFNSGISVQEIANDIERTIGSIEYQLVKEGLMKEEDTTYSKNRQSRAINDSINNNLSNKMNHTNIIPNINVQSNNDIDEDLPE